MSSLHAVDLSSLQPLNLIESVESEQSFQSKSSSFPLFQQSHFQNETPLRRPPTSHFQEQEQPSAESLDLNLTQVLDEGIIINDTHRQITKQQP